MSAIALSAVSLLPPLIEAGVAAVLPKVAPAASELAAGAAAQLTKTVLQRLAPIVEEEMARLAGEIPPGFKFELAVIAQQNLVTPQIGPIPSVVVSGKEGLLGVAELGKAVRLIPILGAGFGGEDLEKELSQPATPAPANPLAAPSNT